MFLPVDRDKSGRIRFFGSSGGTSGFGLQIGTVPTRSGRLASMLSAMHNFVRSELSVSFWQVFIFLFSFFSFISCSFLILVAIEDEQTRLELHALHLGVFFATFSFRPPRRQLKSPSELQDIHAETIGLSLWKQRFVRHFYTNPVRPVRILEYAGPVWDSCTLEDCLRVEKLQLSVARAILRACRRTKWNVSFLAEIGWPTLAWRRQRYKLLLFWKLLNQQGLPSLQSKLPPHVSKRTTQTLRKNTFRQAVCV